MVLMAPRQSYSPIRGILAMAIRRRQVLLATTKVELLKKYSGSVLGPVWIFLFPALLLGIYLFIYAVVFPVKMAEFSNFDFVLYVFSGMIPYLGLVEVLGTGTLAVKQNIHLVKNVMMPIELIPIRSTTVGIVGQLVSLAVLLVLIALHGSLTLQILWLPLVLALQFIFLAGLVYFCSALAVSLPDISYFISLFLMLLMFVSPIGYRPDMLPAGYWPIIYFNPIFYMIEVFRDCLFYGRLPSPANGLLYAGICFGTFLAGTGFFSRFKNILIDYE
ncbi:MAG: ABC transporter permease [Alphaproteobacteria bacterium]|nr:ABC transporter permease [Alphaproteobacteria bacterium]